ncbi:hexamerin-1.1-like [Toxorhynchites rutilus septentrionalis]|uniref:hexamerin-1.1-like n=1 Tax=Toxorhynchites rutilus septentrionalis TaxID=329112 RepID=UPI00247AE764|nr:hexamerin-1.1-like [Toxorhynchites rutilus septentrionalis]
MRSILAVTVVCLFATASGSYMTKDVTYADKPLLVKQKAILEIFQHVHQPELHTTLWEDSKKYDVEQNIDHYTNQEAVKEFIRYYKHGLLPMEQIFSINNEHQREEVIALFHLFYYAKDWDTFYKTMVWARFHVNEGMFVYALTVAVLHRSDMQGIVLPAPYEIYPYYFFNDFVISKAQRYKMQGFYKMKKLNNVYTAYIPTNYTGSYVHTGPEQRVAYFTEDIGLNSYYYYFHADYPFWMGGKEFGLYKDRRGEFYLYQHQQLLARYYLERLANNLGVIPSFSWHKSINTGYNPFLRYYNGIPFPARNYYYSASVDKSYMIEQIEDYEHRIMETIDYGFVVLPDGTHLNISEPAGIEYLGNLIQANEDSPNTRFYGNLVTLAKLFLGGSYKHQDDYHYVPSVLEKYETALRDPMFYQFYKRIMHYYYRYLDHLPSYKKEQLNFPGVKIENVEMDKLVTYFDKFDADITNAVDVEVFDETTMKSSDMKKFGKIAHYQGEDFVIYARQPRLNHLPFTTNLHVTSDKAQKALVVIFIGPKYNEYGNVYGVDENRENFFELDHFLVDLVEGKNTITRKSQDFSWFVKDRTTYFELYKQVMQAYSGEGKFPLDMSEAHCGFPERLMLPKGKKGGMPYQFFFMVTPYHAPKVERFTGYDQTLSCGVGSGARYIDELPFGYPLERQIDESAWFTPNMKYYDTMIYHKSETEVNSVVV